MEDKIYIDGGFSYIPSIIGILEAFRKYKARKCKVLSVGNIVRNIQTTSWNIYQMEEELYNIISTAKQQSDD